MQAFRDLSRFACETSVFSQLDLTLVFDFQTDFFLFFFTSYSLSTLSMISNPPSHPLALAIVVSQTDCKYTHFF